MIITILPIQRNGDDEPNADKVQGSADECDDFAAKAVRRIHLKVIWKTKDVRDERLGMWNK